MARAKSEFVSSLGSGFEFVKAISDRVRELGGNDDDLRRVMAEPALCQRVAEAIMGRDAAFPSLTLAADLIPKGWTVVEDVAPSSFKISDLEFFSFLKSGEWYVPGETMRERARKEKANLGLVDAKFILEHQEEILPALRSKYIVLPGTVVCYSVGYRYAPYLRWNGVRWVLDFNRLDFDWDSDYRLARCKSR